MIKIKIILFFLLASNGLFSQKIIQEKTIIQTNSNFYLAGENILYKTICLNSINNLVSKFSKIGYVELLDSNNKSVIKQKVSLDKGIAFSDIFIPTNLISGSYKLVFYTNWSMNFENLDTINLFIFNPYLPIPENVKDNNSNSTIEPLKTNLVENNLISTNKKEYSKREKIVLKIADNLNQLKGNFVVNIFKSDSLPKIENTDLITKIDNIVYKENNISNLKYLAENRGEVYSGKIENSTDENDISNKKMALSLTGEDFVFDVSTSNKLGVFNFILNKTTKDEAVLQVYENDREKFKVSLIENDFSEIFKKHQLKKYSVSKTIGKYIKQRSIANQIQSIYYSTKKDTVFGTRKQLPFYYGSNREYLIADYNPQNSIKEVYIEVIPEIYTTNINKKTTIRINDYETENLEYYLNPITLVDGYLIQNPDDILNLDPKFFTKINVVNKGYFLHGDFYNGIINLTTKEQNFDQKLNLTYNKTVSLLKPENKKKYFNLIYQDDQFKLIPDYRFQLYWEPNLTEITANKEFILYASDITGNFTIKIEGITENGEAISLENNFTVK